MDVLPFPRRSSDRTRDRTKSVSQPAPKSRRAVKAQQGANLRPKGRRTIYNPAKTDCANAARIPAWDESLIEPPPSIAPLGPFDRHFDRNHSLAITPRWIQTQGLRVLVTPRVLGGSTKFVRKSSGRVSFALPCACSSLLQPPEIPQTARRDCSNWSRITRESRWVKAYLSPPDPTIRRKSSSPTDSRMADTKTSRLPGGTTIPSPRTALASCVPWSAVARTGRPLANIPVSLEGITRSAASARCGRRWISAKFSRSFSRSDG